MYRIKHADRIFAPKKAQICRLEVIIVKNKYSVTERVSDNSKV